MCNFDKETCKLKIRKIINCEPQCSKLRNKWKQTYVVVVARKMQERNQWKTNKENNQMPKPSCSARHPR